MPDKTVFILGAGFSVPSGVPEQRKLLSRVIDQQIQRVVYPWLGNNQPEIERGSVLRFIEQVFGLKEDQVRNLELEDFFTPIHQCLAKDEKLKSIPRGRLELVQRNLTYLLAHAINHGHDSSKEDYVKTFSNKICDVLKIDIDKDPCSVISLNWDIVTDRISFKKCEHDNGCLDYCCECVEIDSDEVIESGQLAKNKGKYTFKILKPHGSLNWASCPKCEQLYAKKSAKVGLDALTEKVKCRSCKNVKLEHSIILPSFKKDLEKTYYKKVWNQTAVELSTATRLVFIGYSFPLADFDFRSLITKHTGKVRVTVVLYDQELPTFQNHPGYVNPDWNFKDRPNTKDGERYLCFFGDKIDKIYYCGVEEWIEHHMDEVLP